MKALLSCTALAVALLGASHMARADDFSTPSTQSDYNHSIDNYHWVARLGYSKVHAKPSNGQLAGMKADVGSSQRPTASIEYLLTPHWGFELLLAAPFSHTVSLNGARSAHTRELPPVLGVNYHFRVHSVVSPFVGVGANYTYFFDDKTRGALTGNSIRIDNSWGFAAHAGVDFNISKNWLVTADVRWINLDTGVKLNGQRIGNAVVNPLVYGLSVGYRF